MKKRILTVLLILVMAMSLAGCTKKACVHISVDGIGRYAVTGVSTNIGSLSENNNEIDATLKSEGEYTIYLEGEDGKLYPLKISYYDGNVDVSSDDDLTIDFYVK